MLHFLLAFAFLVNAPTYHITSQVQVMQVKNAVMAASQQDNENTSYPIYNDVPLDKNLLQHIWNLSNKYDVSYELILAVIKTESNFDERASSGSSLGLMQLNKYSTMHWLKQQVGIRNFNPFNPYHNTEAGVFYLNYLRLYWLAEGFSEEDAFALTLISYNQGISRAKRYVKRHGFNSSYVTKVQEYKYQLESGEVN